MLSYIALLIINFLNTFEIVKGKINREQEKKKKDEQAAEQKRQQFIVWARYMLKNGTFSSMFYVLFISTLLVVKDNKYSRYWAIAGAIVLLVLALKSYRQGPIQGYAFNLAYDVLATWKIVRYFLYMALLYVGVFLHSSFLSFLLLDVISINSNLRTVVQAITLPFRKMVSLFALFCLSIIIFSSTGYLLFGKDYFCEDCDETDEEDWANAYCTNLWTCFLLFFSTGIRTGGDLGEIVFNTPAYGDQHYYANIIFLVAFFIFIGVLLFNMVTGIILDTFSSLREAENAKNEKLNNETFISGLQRSYCQERGVDFNRVNKYDQCVWNYLFFMIHLKHTDPSKHTGVEQYLSEKLKESDTGWFPHFTSFSLVQANTAASMEDSSMEGKIELVAQRLIRQLEKGLQEREERLASDLDSI